MNATLKDWVERGGTPVKIDEDFTIYQVETNTLYEDPLNKVRVLRVGPQTDCEVKTVLLLGETGNGKTLFLNAFLNILFGVQVDDNIRLQLKDQIDTEDKGTTESQTEYTSIYNISYQEGMLYPYNYRIIDTPGFGDTSGADRDEMNRRSIRFCMSSETWVGHLNSIGLVWKASDRRYDERKKEILCQIKHFLAYNTKHITDVLLTFSVNENRDGLRVIDESGLNYEEVFPFDNKAIYKKCPADTNLANLHKLDWEDMEESHNTFLEALNQRNAVSLKTTAELSFWQTQLEDMRAELKTLRLKEEEIHNRIGCYTRRLRSLEGEVCNARITREMQHIRCEISDSEAQLEEVEEKIHIGTETTTKLWRTIKWLIYGT